jgi:hypothetical protein
MMLPGHVLPPPVRRRKLVCTIVAPKAGDIGDNPREYEFEPLTAPSVPEPITVPAPVAPEPVKEPAHV